MKRIPNTGADYEAQSYEANGMNSNDAWILVLKTFEARVKDMSDPEKALARTFYFVIQGGMA